MDKSAEDVDIPGPDDEDKSDIDTPTGNQPAENIEKLPLTKFHTMGNAADSNLKDEIGTLPSREETN